MILATLHYPLRPPSWVVLFRLGKWLLVKRELNHQVGWYFLWLGRLHGLWFAGQEIGSLDLSLTELPKESLVWRDWRGPSQWGLCSFCMFSKHVGIKDSNEAEVMVSDSSNAISWMASNASRPWKFQIHFIEIKSVIFASPRPLIMLGIPLMV